jgi:GDP-D-mannose dehydratase
MIKNSKKFERPNEIKKIASNSNKLIKEFKWKPKYNLNDIALKMLNKEFF